MGAGADCEGFGSTAIALPESLLCSYHVPVPKNDPYPVIMTQDEVEFLIAFAVGQMPRSWVHAWVGKDRLKAEAARERVSKQIAERFAGLQVRKPPPLPAHDASASRRDS